MGRHILTIWGKELLDTLRDRRTLVVMILVPALMMPVFTLLPQYLMRGQIQGQETASLVIDVQGASHGPELVEFLRQAGAEIREVPGEPSDLVREDQARAVLVIPPGFQAQLEAERPAPLTIVQDDSDMMSSVAAGRVRDLVNQFAQRVAADRLARRGLDTDLLKPLDVGHVNVASQAQMGGVFLGMFVPMFLVLFAFLGGMYTAIDVTAGEKERGTLEPLLVAPVSRTALVLGKLLAVFVTSFGAVILSLLSTYIAFQLIPSDFFGRQMSFTLPLEKMLWLILAALPLTVLLNGVEIITCIFARSFKEAQNYITPLQLGLMLPALVVGFLPGFKAPAWSYLVPTLGQMAIFRDVLAGGPLDRGHLVASLVSASVCAVVAVAAAVRTFQRESVLFRT